MRTGFGKGRFMVNDVEIVDNDLEAGNGLIHVIEEVLIPPEFKLLDPIASSPRELNHPRNQPGVPFLMMASLKRARRFMKLRFKPCWGYPMGSFRKLALRN